MELLDLGGALAWLAGFPNQGNPTRAVTPPAALDTLASLAVAVEQFRSFKLETLRAWSTVSRPHRLNCFSRSSIDSKIIGYNLPLVDLQISPPSPDRIASTTHSARGHIVER